MLPAKWRPKDPKLVLTAILWPIKVERYLLVLPPERWQMMLDAFKTKPLGDEKVAALRRVIGGTSAPLVLDKVGRFLLPDHLAGPAGLEKEVQFVGCVENFEIWNPERRGVASPDDKTLAAAAAQEMNI
jgi:MraZ protein